MNKSLLDKKLLELDAELKRRGAGEAEPMLPGAKKPPSPAEQQSEETKAIGQIIEKKVMKYAAPAITGAASMVGAEVGLRSPNPLLGAAAGGALGAAGGALVPDATRALLQAAGVEGLDAPRSVGEQFRLAAREGIYDLAATGMSPLLGMALRGGAKTLLGMVGVTPSGRKLAAKIAQEEGIDLSPAAVSSLPSLVRFSRDVLGRIPLLHAPWKKGSQRMAAEVLESKDRLFLRMGPVMGMAEVGIDLHKAMDKRFSRFRGAINGMYKKALDTASANGTTVPMAETQKELVDQMKILQEKFGAVPETFKTFVTSSLKGLKSEIPFSRFDGLGQQLDIALRDAKSPIEAAALLRVKKAMARDMLQTSDQEVVKQILEADRMFYRAMTEVFETPIAKKMETQVTKNRFHIGLNRPGTKYPEETANLAFNMKSAQAMKDFRALVGEDKFQSAVLARVDDLWNSALAKGGEKAKAEGTGGIDIGWFRKQLGLDHKNTTQYAMFKEALDNTDIPMARMEQFINAVEKAQGGMVPEVNNFLARRVTLAGWKGLAGAFIPGYVAGGAGGGAISAGVFMILGRSMGEILNRPGLLKLAEESLNGSLSLQRRRMAGLALLAAVRDNERMPDPASVFPNIPPPSGGGVSVPIAPR